MKKTTDTIKGRTIWTGAEAEASLVEFFRGEGAQLGTEGDDKQRAPAEQAIESMRELLKMRGEIERSRRKGVMRAAVEVTCTQGHRHYREAHSPEMCPWCQQREIAALKGRIESALQGIVVAYQVLNGGPSR